MYNALLNNSCQANISVKHNKVKTYPNSTIYLKDRQEFEIELFNPAQTTKLAKISINGKYISSAGIVLKPGQRIFLERYIDEPKKFLFETYEVENSSEALKAIANNGNIKIEFYDEYVAPIYNTTITYRDNNDWLNKPRYASGQGSTISLDGCCNFMSSTFSNTAPVGELTTNSLKETGRVEKGDYSKQKFTNYSGSFNSWVSRIIEIKILPFSQKPLEVKDLAEYCTNCGTTNKKGNYKFCPKCGNKY